MTVNRWTLINALKTSAEVYDADAALAREKGSERLAEQFDEQANEARKLSDEIEAAEGSITLSD